MNLADATILDAIENPQLFKRWFKNPATWRAWFAFLRALFGLLLSDDDLAIYRQCTGRAAPPPGGTIEAWLVVGRRGGKSLILALIAVFLAVFRNWSPYLTPGERGMIQIIACDKKQARTIFRYARALLMQVPALAPLVERIDGESIDLTNGISIEISAASFRSIRGCTVIAALCDEIAFWRSDDSANPDSEILAAIRPAMATVPGAMLLCASSPYAKRGVLYDAFRESFGKEDAPALVWKADTPTMNPTVPQSVIDKAYERDPANAAAEYGAQFRTDIEGFVSPEVIDAAVVPGRHELPPVSGVSYVAFVDPSGGSSDSMTLAISHCNRDGRAILDAVRERKPPFSPENVVTEYTELLKSYGVSRVTGDRYAGEWPRERFRTHGIEYEPAEKPKSDLYRDTLPLLNSGTVELLDNARLTNQLCSLERRTARGGKDSIDHAPGAHDDLANAVAGAVVLAATSVAPALWHRSGFLINGSPAPMPTRADYLFAVLAVGARGDVGVIYFAHNRAIGVSLMMIDADLVPLAPSLFADVASRLAALAQSLHAQIAPLFAPGPLAEESHRHGYPAENIDVLLGAGEELALSAATHIVAGRVKASAEVIAKSAHLALGSVLDATACEDDPLRSAALVGIVLALDEHRSLTVRAA